VAEYATTFGRPPFFAPPGRIVQIGPAGAKVLAPVPFPTILRWGTDGLYATSFSVGGDSGAGAIFRITTE
jgi:hypothetical protein